MPEQPADPLHHEMKIPPEPKDAPLHKAEQQHGAEEAAGEADTRERPGKKEGDVDPSRSSGH